METLAVLLISDSFADKCIPRSRGGNPEIKLQISSALYVQSIVLRGGSSAKDVGSSRVYRTIGEKRQEKPHEHT